MLSIYRKRISKVILLIASGLAAQVACAATFPIDIKKDLHGVKVFAETTTIDVGSIVNLKVTNMDQQKISCRIIFNSRVEQRKTFSRSLEPGAATSVHYSPSRQINRLVIELNCAPA